MSGNSFLNSEYLDPVGFLYKAYDFLQTVFHVVFTHEVLNLFYTILIILVFFFLTLISYCLVRLFEIRKKEEEHLHHELAEYAHRKQERERKKEAENAVSRNPRWAQTIGYLFSENPGDWKLAIIEADSKLRAAKQETFKQLTSAWEVHAIRNRIAHEGLAYEISHHEAKRTIALYENIFREYGYI